MKNLFTFVLMLVLVLVPVAASAQSAQTVDPTIARFLEVIEKQNASNAALNEKLIGLLSEMTKRPATAPAPAVDAVALDRLSRQLLSVQASQQLAAAPVDQEKKGFVRGVLLPTILPSVASFTGGYLLGNHVGDNRSFNRASELVSRMPQPVMNVSSYSGGSTSRTFVGGSTLLSSNTLNPNLSANGFGGNSNASASPYVNTSANSNSNPSVGVTANGGQGGSGGSSSANANPFVSVRGGNASANPYVNANGGSAFADPYVYANANTTVFP